MVSEWNQDYKSLDPSKAFPTPLEDLFRIVDSDPIQEFSPIDQELIFQFLDRFIKDIRLNYPHNIFWDFDFIFQTLVNRLGGWENESDKKKFFRSYSDQFSEILFIFGNQSTIQFKYIHDFLYGFDWCKWSRKNNPESHPFSESFLGYIRGRGLELIEQIDKGDSQYIPIQSEEYRNPFVFDREDENEITILEHLALNEEIPVQSWKRTKAFRNSQNFSRIRSHRAFELGISANEQSGAHKYD